MLSKILLENIKKAVVFIGTKDSFIGTGVLVQIDDIFHLITAKHVVSKKDENSILKEIEGLFVYKNSKNQKPVSINLDQLRKTMKYCYHYDDNVDLALIPLPINPDTDDVKVIEEDWWLKSDSLYETNGVFLIAFQPGISVYDENFSINPIIRKGMISQINKDGTYLIDGNVFPGNSGSPVFMFPSIARVNDTGDITMGPDKLAGKFLGIVSRYIPYQDIAISQQTGRPRIVFEENTGLSIVNSVDLIYEIINSETFKTILKPD